MELLANNSLVQSADGALYTYPELLFNAVAFSILIVVATAGNILVLVAVAKTKRLQTVTNVFVVNLSVSDCLSSFAFLWSVPGMASRTPEYPIQLSFPCVAAGALVFIAVGCSLYTLANIALNRCVLITMTKETYQWLYTTRKIALMVVASWLIPSCAIILPPLVGVGDVGFDPESRTCSDIDTHPRAGEYDKIQFAVLYPMPLVAIVVSYLQIWRHVRRHFKRRRRGPSHAGPWSSTTACKASAPSGSHHHGVDDNYPSTEACSAAMSLRQAESTRSSTRQPRRARDDQIAITKNLFVVVLAFVICFSPLSLMVVSKRNRYQLYGAMILFLSGCINPIIYAAKHPHFRPVLRAMVRCRRLKD